MADATASRRGGFRRIKEEDIQAIEDRLLRLERRVKKDHEGSAQYAARDNAEKHLKKKSLYEQEHEIVDEYKGNDVQGGGQHNSERIDVGDYDDREIRRNDRLREHVDNPHRNEGKPLELDASGNRHFSLPSTDVFVMATVFGLVLMAALYLIRKVRRQRTRSYQSID
ncbi:hypothetical protein DYB32_006084 [Aphanomyces invadans]|uniref:Uncharacterized protein n=1 Tax=Aphanomyces invadans TaxID=157072 RepID=A0A418ASX3_9STRA|nr:hypothetical protein DYB32_006084 [Aphanomyces invadans]